MTFMYTRKCKECGEPFDTEVCWNCREQNKKKRESDGRRTISKS